MISDERPSAPPVSEPLVQYTGHPLVDAGAAVLAVLVDKDDPRELTLADLDAAADEMLRAYATERMRSYLSVLFPNSAYINPTMGEDKRSAFYETYLRAYRRSDDIGVRCVFTGRPAQVRIYRQHLPLITGEGLFNFLPGGDAGLPVSGTALLCIQAMPLGTLRSQGRALLVHSSQNRLTFQYARRFYNISRQAELLAGLGDSGPSPRSMVLRELGNVALQARRAHDGEPTEGVTVYHFTNYGTNADVDIYPLPAFVVDFVLEAQALPSWHELVAHYWPEAKKGVTPVRNRLYEQVFGLPDNAQSFVREFLLGRPRFRSENPGPRASWELVNIFLRKVLDMPQTRIQAITSIAENLAQHIGETRNLPLFLRVFRTNSFNELMFLLARAKLRALQGGSQDVMSFDECLSAFAIAEDLARPDWRLARDLMLLRMMETPAIAGLLAGEDAKKELGEALAETEQQPTEQEA